MVSVYLHVCMHKQFGDQFSSKLFNTKLKKSTTILPKLLHIYNISYVEELGAKYQHYIELYKLFIMDPLSYEIICL